MLADPAAPGRRAGAGARARHRGRGRCGARRRQPDGPARLGRRGPHRAREPHPARPAAGPASGPRPRRGRPSCSRHSGSPTRPAGWSRTTPAGMRRRLDIAASIVVTPRADVPRRADDRARPALAQPGLGHHPRAGRRGDHDPALHAVPRRGRPARRGDRRDRPRQGDRRGHARPAQGLGRRRAPARAAARPRAAARGRAVARARARRGAPGARPRGAVASSAPMPIGPPRPSPSWPAPVSGSPTSRSASRASTRCSWR